MLPDPLFLNVHMYGIMIGLGLLACFIVLFTYFKKKGIEPAFTDFVFYNAIASIAVGFGAAALFQAFYNYLENPEAGFNFGGGITFIGGLIGGAACFLIVYFIFRKKYKSSLVDVLSIVPCCILIAHAFGRIGCFFAGCCHGIETNSFLGVQFPHLDYPVHPTQLYEAAFLFIMFAICSYLVLKKNFQHNMSLYLISYGVFRFLIEYIRGDDRGKFLSIMSPSQFWSIVMIIGGIVLIFFFRKMLQSRSQLVGGDVERPSSEGESELKEKLENDSSNNFLKDEVVEVKVVKDKKKKSTKITIVREVEGDEDYPSGASESVGEQAERSSFEENDSKIEIKSRKSRKK